MNKHCKADCQNIGKCQTCGMVQDGFQIDCPLEIYDKATDWCDIYDNFLCVALALVAAYGFAKAFCVV